MPWTEKPFYLMECDGTTIAITYWEGEGWEVYYKRPMFPLMFAFGLPAVHTAAEVFDIAAANIHQYEDMFE